VDGVALIPLSDASEPLWIRVVVEGEIVREALLN
jgi:hypothetical protein